MAKSKAVAVEGSLLQLDPAVILADDNTRFNLKESRVQSLSESILARGGVLEPVEVEPLAEASSNGHTHRLTTGFYRLAAVTLLNKQSGAGLTIPAVVRPTVDPKERLMKQLAENMERENQSPMDQAVAIKRLLDMGYSKMQVRELYKRPGGRKGNKTQPASNSFLNMTLSFLDLPKAIQEKIHLGTVGVAAAYQLTKVAPDQRAAVLARAEEERQKDLEREEREEERSLAQEEKENKAKATREKEYSEVTKSSEAAKQAQESLAVQTQKVQALHGAAIGKHADAKAKKEAMKVFKEAEKQRVILEADADAATKVYEGLQVRFTKHETLAAEKAQKLAAARAAAPAGAAKKGAAVSGGDVQKAATAVGASTNYVALNAAEMRKVVSEMALPGGKDKTVAIGQALVRCFSGEITQEALYKAIDKIVG